MSEYLLKVRELIGPPDYSGRDAEDSTRDRLLDAAEKLFAERGYTGVSVRQVTTAAGSNIASVNYHFGNKDGLYTEMYRRRLREMRERRIHGLQQAVESGGDLETVLAVFATVFLEPVIERGDSAVVVKLWMQELTSQHLPPSTLMNEMVKPVTGALIAALQRAEPGLSEFDARMSIHSLVGQLVHVVMSEPIYGDQDFHERPLANVEAVIEHIVDFSAAGIRALVAKSSRREATA